MYERKQDGSVHQIEAVRDLPEIGWDAVIEDEADVPGGESGEQQPASACHREQAGDGP